MTPQAPDRLSTRLARRTRLARLALWWEAAWVALWPPLGVIGLFGVVALSGLPLVLPWPLHLLLLAALPPPSAGPLNQRAASMGVSVKLTNMLTRIVPDMVMPNDLRNLPTIPSIMAIGRNTATSETVMAITARPISAVAAVAAWKGEYFFSSM